MRLAPILLLVTLTGYVQADEIDDLARAELKAANAPGLTLAVVKDGKVVKIGAYGIANLETKTTVTPETVFRVASMSKQFCSAAAILLVQDGKWKLDDPISKFVDKAPAAWSKVTIRHLLTHTSGMPALAEADGFTFRANPGPDRFIEMLAKKPLAFTPGEKFAYSNEGYSLLGVLIGKVAGKPLNEVVRERLFGPVGMSSTSYYRLESVVDNRANGYIWDKDHHENAIPLRPYAMAGSGGIQSSILDWIKWDAALNTESPLAKAVRDQLWTSGKLNDGKATGYGFGWVVSQKDGKKMVSHSGGTAGFTSHFIRHLDGKITVIVLENVQNGGAVKLATSILDWYLKQS